MESLYLEPRGFLGTGASLLADLTLAAYVLLIVPAMIGGLVLARRGLHRPHHRNLMIAVTAANWILIVLLMLAALRHDVAGNIPSQPGNLRYLMPAIHGLLGLPAQVLATYIVYRMWREDSQVAAARARGERGRDLQKYWFRPAKPAMRIALILWLAVSLMGVANYLIRYDVLRGSGAGSPAPAATAEAAPQPVATGETGAPASTPEPETTPEPSG